jgi:indolepyruvate ferredoxin oxidoreductase beta subunit
LISSSHPVVNIPNYPELDVLLKTIRSLPKSVLLDGEGLARRAGSILATNMVMVGASSRFLPVKPETIERFIRKIFGGKGERVVESNLRAFRAGREAAAVA